MSNKTYKDLLQQIVNEHPKSFARVLHTHKEYQYLVKWINEQTPLLSDPIYTLTTKLYWILHDIVDFPICLHCGNKLMDRNIFFKYGYGQYCSVSCQRHSKIRLEHALETNEKLHGSRNFNNKEKREATNLKKYGTKHNMQSKLGMREYRDAMQEKYGIDYSWQLSSTIEKSKQTSFKHFGVYNTSQAQQTKDKQAKTNIKLYGSKCALQNNNVYQKTVKTMIENYGAAHPSHCKDIISRRRKRYTYDNKNFDSQPEIAFYIWLKDNNIKFEYQPKDKAIMYIGLDNKQHIYYPDFYLIETNELIEIKGDQFFDINGNPNFGKYNWSAKYSCMKQNNIKIYTSKDYQKYLDYIKVKYNKRYLLQFKNI